MTGANARTNANPQPGLYLFTKQHYSIVTLNGTEPRKDFGTAADPAKLTDAEKMARYEAWRTLTANSGTYQVSGSTLTTRPLVAKDPAVMGPEVNARVQDRREHADAHPEAVGNRGRDHDAAAWNRSAGPLRPSP